jgi:D-alanine-D-alanine ligase
MRVTVLHGGWGSEREVSLVSGREVAGACRTLGHETLLLDMGASPADGRTLAARLLETRPDVVFNALHGTPGEDGTVQGLMDLLGLAYTHSGVAASAIAIDKERTKRLLVPAGIRMPAGRIVESAALHDADPLPRPYVLKPNAEGSSVGVAIVTRDSNYGDPIARDAEGPWKHFAQLLAEPFVAGHELTVAVAGGDDARAMGVTELVPLTGFYDYDAKYTDGLTRHEYPANIPADVAESACRMALEAHRLLGCRGVSRSDFRWDDAQGEAGLYLLEVNTQPGMTPLSLVPEQARHNGIGYEALVQMLLDAAREGR